MKRRWTRTRRRTEMMRSEIPSRREVEDHNLTHIVFIIW